MPTVVDDVWPSARAPSRWAAITASLLGQLAIVFVAYFIAGKLGQATTNIRSSNLGPVWPVYGIALAAFLAYGYRVWPAVAISAFLVAVSGSVSPLGAAGQALGAVAATLTGTFFLRRIPHFDPELSRLRDALGLIVIGAFGSALISASIGVFSLYATQLHAYSGLPSAWLIYWLGDSTGVLLITPVVFTIRNLFELPSRRHLIEFVALMTLVAVACAVIFGDWPLFPVRLHVLAFAVLPLVTWGAISFGVAGSALSVLLIATIATLSTALGSGPFAANTSFINAVLLDVLFAVLAVSGLTLAAVISERERAESRRQALIRDQAAVEARLRLAAIVESTEDAILSMNLDGIVLSWNAAAERIFGYPEAEIVGRPAAVLFPPELREKEGQLLQRLRAGDRIQRYETIRLTKAGDRIDIALSMSPLTDSAGQLLGAAEVARDVTERNLATKALSGLSRRLIHAQEEERSRIARDLHDDIGQRVALLSVELGDLSAAPGIDAQTARLQTLASEIASDIQALSHRLHSSKLELLGVSAAMQSFCGQFGEQHGVTVDFQSRDVSRHLPAEISLCLFRILQEALHNAAKHSGARHFSAELSGSGEEVQLVVSDAGTGFDLDAARGARGLGLVSMEERLKLVDGSLAVETQPGRGTRIRASVPLPSES